MDKSKPKLSEKVEALQHELQDVIHEDYKLKSRHYLSHWLQVHNLNVERSAKAIRANLIWRKENNIEELLNQDFPPDIRAEFPVILGERGKNGTPVAYCPAGALAVTDLMKEFGKERLVRYIAQFALKLEKIVFDYNNEWSEDVDDVPADRIMTTFVIYDAKNFSLKNVASLQGIQFYVEWAKISSSYFPSANCAARIINPSKIIEVPLSMIRPLLSRRYDVIVVKNTEEAMKEHVFSVVEPEMLQDFQKRVKALKDQ